MTQTIIYDLNGSLRGLQQRNDDGSVIFAQIGTDLWNAYVIQNGAPPANSAPTFPPDPVPQGVQTAIADFKNYLSKTPAQTQAAMGISALQDAFNRDVIAALAYLNSQLTK